MSPLAQALYGTFVRDFWAANHDIRWVQLEHERSLQLSDNVLLVGRIDAIGETPDARPFFADWKTASKSKAYPKNRESLKAQWRLTPQALTYGVLLKDTGIREFTVRWMFKTDPPTTDFEWYSYTDAELEWWQAQLLDFAERIRALRHEEGNWPLNLNNCTRYGEQYKCPFRDQGCHKLNFGFVPEGMLARNESHIQLENKVATSKSLVVLDATRVNDYINCPEFYRRMWEKTTTSGARGLTEDSESLRVGKEVHDLIHGHLSEIMKGQSK